MARCDEGYRCEVCGQDVEDMADSDLYLRYILGEVPLYRLHQLPERHVRCNPALAQYIVDSSFAPVECPGPFAKAQTDPEFAKREEARVTRAWRRLQILPSLRLPIDQYPIATES
ncbi:MAG: hypothetical protein ACJ8C4_08425 [Gemmataceae bacterium]